MKSTDQILMEYNWKKFKGIPIDSILKLQYDMALKEKSNSIEISKQKRYNLRRYYDRLDSNRKIL